VQVLFESLDSQATRLRSWVVRRVRFVMRRLSWLAPRARVQLAEVNRPHQGIYKRCQIELQTDSAGPVVITALARDWRSALDSALSRAASSLPRLRRGLEQFGQAGDDRHEKLPAQQS
jgi:hypothetical protein